MNNGLGPIGTHRSVDRVARCIFCGVIGTWWTCGCEWGCLIREGKLPKPRTVVRGGVAVIELCEELRLAAGAAGVITGEYGRDGKGLRARNRGVKPSANAVSMAETKGSGGDVSSGGVDVSSGGANKDRKAYMRDLMRRRRARARGDG
jgi:hypothetical protein